MTARAPTESELRAFLNAFLAKNPGARFIGVRAKPEWKGGDRLALDGREAIVVPCRSPLEFTAALVDHADSPEPVVLLTDGKGIPSDAHARLASQRLRELRPFSIVRSLFSASQLDPAVVRHAWMAEALIALAPARGYPPAPLGVLDIETAWRSWFARLFDLDSAKPSPAELLRWSADPRRVTRFAEQPEEPRDAAAAWLRKTVGPAAAAILRFASRGDGDDALPAGLVLGVLRHEQAPPMLEKPAIIFEAKVLGEDALEPAVARSWADTAASVLREELARDAGGIGRSWIDRAEAMLLSARAADFAWLSPVLRMGLAQRLGAFGETLDRVIRDEADPDELREVYSKVGEHALIDTREGLAGALSMAMRLARWLRVREAADGAGGLEEFAVRHAETSGLIDWARNRIAEHAGDPQAGGALTRLLGIVNDWRERENLRFGALLAPRGAEWSGNGTLLPIERVLDVVVATLAEDGPVLLLVLDGMSLAVFSELSDSFTRHAWQECATPGAERRRLALTAFPSVTELCRTSLLSGKVRTGTADTESKAFRAHAGLVAVTSRSHPPEIFHKTDLRDGEEGHDGRLFQSIGDQKRRVVAVVLNAIDDQLDKGDQLKQRWDIQDFIHLDAILEVARDAERTVILTSDHGHIIERGATLRSIEGAGARWRKAGGAVEPDELLLAGPRVLLEKANEVIVPVSERVRYAGKKHGYHGGASPQEAIVPVAVFRAVESLRDEDRPLPPDRPEWWEGAAPPPRVLPVVVAVPKPRPKRAGQGLLFEGKPAGDWLESLLESDRFRGRKKLAGRRVPEDGKIRALLLALDGAGGSATRKALAVNLNQSEMRLRGILPLIQRILNVDGYEVLAVIEEADTVVLHRELLERQFGAG